MYPSEVSEMPMKSKAQEKLMYAAAAKKGGVGGVSQKAAKEMIAKTPKKKRSALMKGK